MGHPWILFPLGNKDSPSKQYPAQKLSSWPPQSRIVEYCGVMGWLHSSVFSLFLPNFPPKTLFNLLLPSSCSVSASGLLSPDLCSISLKCWFRAMDPPTSLGCQKRGRQAVFKSSQVPLPTSRLLSRSHGTPRILFLGFLFGG